MAFPVWAVQAALNIGTSYAQRRGQGGQSFQYLPYEPDMSYMQQMEDIRRLLKRLRKPSSARIGGKDYE